ncbi:MAG: hypothetical protein AMXMBFR47_12720 [Planctomycetota bacterium]
MARPRILRRADLRKKVRAPAPKRSRKKPSLHVEDVLAWADAHFRRTGDWPQIYSGRVHGAPEENWAAINYALVSGYRGLPKGLTLAKLLWKRRGVRNLKRPPPLTLRQILEWADAHFAATGRWPTGESGAIRGVPRESWGAINKSLQDGKRGLPRGMTIVRLLTRHRSVRNMRRPAPLTVKQILSWADRHHAATGQWPLRSSGAIAGAPGETWLLVDGALLAGLRGLPGGDSLLRLLKRRRGVRSAFRPPRLSMAKVLRWIDEHHARTGRWPTYKSGPVREAPSETWLAIHKALEAGRRGLPGDLTLARVLATKRGVRHRTRPPALSIPRIRTWIEQHHARTGEWPHAHAGAIADAGGETWSGVDHALGRGTRGLSGCGVGSLAKLIGRMRLKQRVRAGRDDGR